ncbi:MAG: hemolysin family protein [Herbinix sp.]|nr:hemolysin family protein [Herbinix sp.]
MDLSDAAQPIILFILLVLSSFFTASEAALNGVNKLRIRTLADDDVRGAKTAGKLIEDSRKMLSAISIGKNVAKLSASAFAAVFAWDYFGKQWVGLTVSVLILLFLIFGSIIPRTISSIYTEKVALTVAGPIYLLTKLLSPIVLILNKFCNGLLRLLGIDTKAKTAAITENELRTILDYSHEEGVIESEERRMITNVVDFGDALAKDVMVPRTDMAFANVDFTYNELIQTFAEEKYTRMPVYSETRDNVIGIVNLKDVFFYNGDTENFNIVDIIREPYFTYEYKKTSELLIEMRKASISLAIVLDEYGATVGLITIEDLLEEIVGEIRDEYDDDEEDSIKAITENEYIVDGFTKLDEINEALGLDLESDDYDSIAGHIIYLLDHLPEEGETVEDNNVVFTVAAIDKNRVDKVHILLKKEKTEALEDK